MNFYSNGLRVPLDSMKDWKGNGNSDEKDAYDVGWEIANMYVEIHGKEKVKEGFEHISMIVNEPYRPTSEMKELYRKIEQHHLKKAQKGFFDYLAQDGVDILEKVPEELEKKRIKEATAEEMKLLGGRNKSFLKFHSDWVLATVRADGQ